MGIDGRGRPCRALPTGWKPLPCDAISEGFLHVSGIHVSGIHVRGIARSTGASRVWKAGKDPAFPEICGSGRKCLHRSLIRGGRDGRDCGPVEDGPLNGQPIPRRIEVLGARFSIGRPIPIRLGKVGIGQIHNRQWYSDDGLQNL